ncbi:Rrf2 family transcriptional regulator [Alkalihalobacillus pseudalcaliphilus]|uniref:Rrf2 family transcriptional regulator n=1 Tax=Alkalihalobacillus pseudalcaliphilus TaxID=79884 RepID=UPI00064D8D1E|nr:Rrf2 family transcriptional regulator [Alkalihalobacillus pseudalcaliphilus]KMK75829.1 Rrf2 family transcriptional regulator [Alkalihalobacillus pseudalcaliphilus]
MKYSKATNYALHTMVYLAAQSQGKAVGVEPLAQKQDLSATYLSKILTKLVKAGLIISSPGVKGGYMLAKQPKHISFLDVIQAIEGQSSLFYCSILHRSPDEERGCLIEEVMIEAEEQMNVYLREKKLSEIVPKMPSGT